MGHRSPRSRYQSCRSLTLLHRRTHHHVPMAHRRLEPQAHTCCRSGKPPPPLPARVAQPPKGLRMPRERACGGGETAMPCGRRGRLLQQSLRRRCPEPQNESPPISVSYLCRCNSMEILLKVPRVAGIRVLHCRFYTWSAPTAVPDGRPPSPVGSANNVAVTSPDVTRCHGMSQGDRERSR